MPRHQRGLVISIIASMILSLVIVGFGRAAINHYLATRGVFLYDALQSPYQIEERTIPLVPTQPDTIILPAAIGSYQWQIPLTEEELEAAAIAEVESLGMMITAVQRAIETYDTAAASVAAATATETEVVGQIAEEPAVLITVEQQTLVLEAALVQLETALPVVEKADTIAEVIAAPEIYPLRVALDTVANSDIALTEVNDLLLHFSQIETEMALPASVNDCLVASEAGSDELPACGITIYPLYLEPGTYQITADAQPVAVTMATFEDHETATSMMKELYTYADTNGQTGNYTLGVTQVDYFYSRLEGDYTFVWSHDNWVYVISALSFTDMEAIATAFPY